MRELKTSDIFKASKILSKINIKVDVKDKVQEQVGSEMILAIGENLHFAEKEVNEFMGDLIGISAKEFSDLPISKTIKYFEEIKKLEGISDFFKSAGRLTK